jgi:antitoxin component YwqK of YwqJK toxin-antitoxin module
MKQTVKSLVFLLFFLFGKMSYAQKQVKIFYDEYWRVSTEAKADFFRLATFDDKGNPVGVIKDYYITGELQWEATLSFIDKVATEKDIRNGVATWYHKNGKISEVRTFVNNLTEGTVVYWDKNGVKLREAEVKSGVLNGKRVEFYPNGKIKTTRNYKDGKLAENWYTECDELGACKKVVL